MDQSSTRSSRIPSLRPDDPPDMDDLEEVKRMLSPVNRNVLFDTRAQALEFIASYTTKQWAETADDGFHVVLVELPV